MNSAPKRHDEDREQVAAVQLQHLTAGGWWHWGLLLLALAGWVFVFATSEWKIILFGIVTLLVGLFFFLAWSKWTRRWPFGPAA